MAGIDSEQIIGSCNAAGMHFLQVGDRIMWRFSTRPVLGLARYRNIRLIVLVQCAATCSCQQIIK
jgi:hypothetical protein